ncbi:MAG: DUF971 domain-containing protein [Pirellulales bacterium]
MQTPIDIQARRDEGRFVFRWADGAETLHPFFDLRCECQCAGCVDENTGRRILDPATVPRDVTVQDAKLVGNYAVKITWSDGHDTGLYTWDFMRSLAAKPN